MRAFGAVPQLEMSADVVQASLCDNTPVDAIIEFCPQQTNDWVASAGGAAAIAELETLVTARPGLVLEEVMDDADLND